MWFGASTGVSSFVGTLTQPPPFGLPTPTAKMATFPKPSVHSFLGGNAARGDRGEDSSPS